MENILSVGLVIIKPLLYKITEIFSSHRLPFRFETRFSPA